MHRYCKLLSKLSLFVLFALIIYSCGKDDDDIEVTTPTTNTNVNTGTEASANEVARLTEVLSSEKTTTNLSITVVNENNTPISGASVIINDNNAVTDNNGFILIENVEVYEEYQTIKISSTGYSDAIKTITPSTNGVTNIAITLIEPTFTASFSANNGGTVSNNNVAIEFPTNAITNQNGDMYEGDVTVTATYYDPNAAIFNTTIPGTLVGLDDDNNMQALISKGMLKVDLTDTAGNELELLEEKEATITLPANENDPETIDLWHLNEEKGIWVKTGTATKVGNEYIAIVTHFSTYNLDISSESIDLKFILTNKNFQNQFLINQEVELLISSEYGNYKINLKTDNKGEMNFLRVPKGANYELNLPLIRKNIVTNLGILNQNLTQEIEIEPTEDARTVNILGILKNCSDEIYKNKVFIIKLNNDKEDIFTAYTDVQGNYSTTKLVYGYDTTSKYIGEIIIYDGIYDIISQDEFTFNSDNNLKDIIICDGEIQISTERTYDGDIIVDSDEKYEELINAGYTNITGNLTLENLSNIDLNELSTLSSVKSITIQNNNYLINLNGLEKIKTLDTFYIINNISLSNLEGFNGLEKINSFFHIRDNEKLENLKGLENLKEIYNLVLSNNNNLLNFEGLENLDTINGAGLWVDSNSSLTNFEGLNNLTHISGDFNVSTNENLSNFKGLENLNTITARFMITDNPVLPNFEGLNNLNTISISTSRFRVFLIENNNSLINFKGLENLDSFTGTLMIQSNNNLINLEGLNKIEQLSFFTVRNNYSLVNLQGVSSLKKITTSEIQNNTNLMSLEGLNNLTYVFENYINSNYNLTDFCALTKLFTSQPIPTYDFHSNAYNPTKQDLLDGNCSE